MINIGTNDFNIANNVSSAGYVSEYKMLIEGVHAIWPQAQIILIVRVLSNSTLNVSTNLDIVALGRLWAFR